MKAIFKSEIKQKYEFKDVLGDGNFAEVRLGVNKDSKKQVAIKIIEPKDKQDEKMIKAEIEILSEMDHKNIVHLYEAFEQPAKVLKARKTYLVMELMTGGELLERIYQKKRFTERESRMVMSTLFDVLAYIHGKGIVHRDLKPGNILYANDRDDSPVKVVDFGCAAKLPDPNAPLQGLVEVCGTPIFVAPEILHRYPQGYGRAVDVWSAGVIMYILLCGFPPFEHDEEEMLFKHIMLGEFEFPSPHWDRISDAAKDLIQKCLTTDPAKRITAADACKHSWITAFDDPIDEHRTRVVMFKQHMCHRRFRRLTNALIAVQRLQGLRH
eukprot:c11429_g1_i1.p1 GENE.c11429_g1_i1~~c11429_g1_i1.p1  ORF type:complete len:325 (-),score=60.79 c11429_g1_i1:69-1043(-)